MAGNTPYELRIEAQQKRNELEKNLEANYGQSKIVFETLDEVDAFIALGVDIPKDNVKFEVKSEQKYYRFKNGSTTPYLGYVFYEPFEITRTSEVPLLENTSSNIFNKNEDIEINSYLNTTGVIINGTANWGRSKFFPCLEGEKINIQGNFGHEGFAFYDENKALIDGSYQPDNHGQKTAPNGAFFYAFNIYRSSNQTFSNIMLNKGNVALPFEPFSLKVKKENIEQFAELASDNEEIENSEKVFKGKTIFNKVDSKIIEEFSKITNSTPSNNLFNLDTDVVDESYLNNSGVIINGTANWGRSKFFPCLEGEKINIQGNFGHEGFAFYDENKALIDGSYQPDNHGQKTAPNGAFFYAFNIYQSSNQSYNNIMVNKGDNALSYEDFGDKLEIKKELLLENSNTYLELDGIGNDVILKGLTTTRVLEALTENNASSSRVFNFKTDKLGNEIVRNNTTDDVAPAHLLSTTLLANHSYYGYLADVIGHNKTDADIGAIYSNGGNNFVITQVNDNSLWLMAENLGNILPENSTLNYVSGGVSNSNIAITTHDYRQIYQCFSDYNLDVIVDNIKINENIGKFNYNKNVIFQESYNLVSRNSVYNFYRDVYNGVNEIVGDELLFNSFSYIFDIDGNCTIAGNYTFNDIISVQDIMSLQAIRVNELDQYYVPKTIGFTHNGTPINLSMIESSTVANGSDINLIPSRLDASAIASDRYLQLASDKSKGFAMGFLPVGDAGLNRAVNTTDKVFQIRGSSNKMYAYLIEKGNFNSNVGQSFSFVGYRNLFVPENGATANYPVRVPNGNDYYFIDYHNTQDLKQITMPSDFVGREIEIVEQRNITCNSTIISSKLTVNVDCLSDYGYLVIKVKK